MAINFERAWKVIVGETEVTGLRVRFKAKKTAKTDPSTLDLSVTNLSAATRAKLSAASSPPVVLIAGYKEAAGLIFAGPARTIDHVRDGADWTTHVLCGDGEQAFRGFSSFSFKAGTKKGDVLTRWTDDLKGLGIDVADAQAAIRKGGIAGLKEVFAQGFAAHGRTMKEGDRLLASIAAECSVVDGHLVITEVAKPTTEPAVVLSAETGLLGSPDHGAPEKMPGYPAPNPTISLLKAKSLLNGELRPLRAMRLEALSRSGFYRIETVEHTGDSHGQDWFTAVEARPL
jgi:hypothetical protein